MVGTRKYLYEFSNIDYVLIQTHIRIYRNWKEDSEVLPLKLSYVSHSYPSKSEAI